MAIYDWAFRKLQEERSLIKNHLPLLIIIILLSIAIGIGGTHLFYKRKSDIGDRLIKTRGSTISTLKDEKDRLKKQLKEELVFHATSIKSLEAKIGNLEKQIVILKKEK
jgi:hypothetical protein